MRIHLGAWIRQSQGQGARLWAHAISEVFTGPTSPRLTASEGVYEAALTACSNAVACARMTALVLHRVSTLYHLGVRAAVPQISWSPGGSGSRQRRSSSPPMPRIWIRDRPPARMLSLCAVDSCKRSLKIVDDPARKLPERR